MSNSGESRFTSPAWLRFERHVSLPPDVHLITDFAGRIEESNSAAAGLFNVAETELAGHSILDFVAEEDRQLVQAKIEGLVHLRDVGRWDARIQPRDGPLRTAEFRMSIPQGSPGDGERRSVFWLVRDVTQRKYMEDRLRLSERLATLGTFASDVAHEINNPLASLLLTARHVQRSQQRADLDSCLADIITDAERCAEIIKKLRAFARHQHPPKTVHDFNTLIRHVESMIRAATDGSGLQFTLTLSREELPILCNPTALEQALTNLLANALHSCQPDQQVLLSTQAVEGKVRAVVRCQGTEAPAARKGDPFEHPMNPIDFTSIGVGLITAYGIIHEHHGEIVIESGANRASTVYVQFPRHERPLNNSEKTDDNRETSNPPRMKI